jgi:hypothetical protein
VKAQLSHVLDELNASNNVKEYHMNVRSYLMKLVKSVLAKCIKQYMVSC